MISRTRQLSSTLALYWQPLLFYGVLLLIFGGLLWFRLGTLVGGYSGNELAALEASGWRHILENPVNAPFLLLVRGLRFLDNDSLLLTRIAAAIFGLATLSVFYWLVRHWHGERTALFGTIILGASPWFLHTARLGTPEVLLFSLLTLVACSIWLKRTDNPLILFIGFALAGLLMYVPGMVWLIVFGAIWHWRTIDRIFKRHLVTVTLATIIFLLLLAPLAWALYNTPELAKVLAGLPAEGWPRILECLERLAMIPINLFVRGPLDPEQWLGRLPILDAFSIAMLALGVFLYIRHWRLARSKFVALVLGLGALLICLGGGVTITLIIPFLYILIAAGMGMMLDRWHAVFPRNIIAQSVGVVLISLALLATGWYGMRHYFVAWPNAPETKQVFTITQP